MQAAFINTWGGQFSVITPGQFSVVIYTKIRKNPAVPCLHKKTPLIAKNPRFKD
jgi:hypothetical protein